MIYNMKMIMQPVAAKARRPDHHKWQNSKKLCQDIGRRQQMTIALSQLVVALQRF